MSRYLSFLMSTEPLPTEVREPMQPARVPRSSRWREDRETIIGAGLGQRDLDRAPGEWVTIGAATRFDRQSARQNSVLS